MKTFKVSYSDYCKAPVMLNHSILSSMSKQQLLDHAIAMTEYLQKLEAGK